MRLHIKCQPIKQKWKRESKTAPSLKYLITVWYVVTSWHSVSSLSTKISLVVALGRKLNAAPPSENFVFSQRNHSYFLCDLSGKQEIQWIRHLLRGTCCEPEQVVVQLP